MKETLKTLTAHLYAILIVLLVCYAVWVTAINHANNSMINYMQQQVQNAQSETIKALDKR
jgi:hypothetical protein